MTTVTLSHIDFAVNMNIFFFIKKYIFRFQLLWYLVICVIYIRFMVIKFSAWFHDFKVIGALYCILPAQVLKIPCVFVLPYTLSRFE